MNKQSQALRVEPLRRYRPPRYPAADAFDPDALKAQPYPFSSRFKTWVTTVGASSLICSWVGAQDAVIADNGNPLSVARSGLPFRTSPYGTGQPSYLSEEQARATIEKVFLENGFKLARDFNYQKDDISFKTGGFDEKARVGYVWADWNSLDPADAIIQWTDSQFSEDWVRGMIESTKGDPARIESYAKSFAAHLGRLDKEGKFRAEIESALDVEDIPKRFEILGDLLEKFKLKESAEKISLREIKALEAEKSEPRDFVAVISQYDQRFVRRGLAPGFQDKLKEALAIEEKDLRAEKIREIVGKSASITLKDLEDSVRDYLAWARGQGLQN